MNEPPRLGEKEHWEKNHKTQKELVTNIEKEYLVGKDYKKNSIILTCLSAN